MSENNNVREELQTNLYMDVVLKLVSRRVDTIGKDVYNLTSNNLMGEGRFIHDTNHKIRIALLDETDWKDIK